MDKQEYSLEEFIEMLNEKEVKLTTLDMYTNGYGIMLCNAYDSKFKCNMYIWANEVIYDWHD